MDRGRAFARACALLGASAATLALTEALTAAPVRAQSATSAAAAPSTGPRLWYEATVGGAGMRLTCDICQPARDVGPMISLAGGVQTSPRVRVGIGVTYWSYEDQSVREKMYGGGLVAQLSPDPDRGLYLQAGLGWTGYRAGEFSYDAPRITVALGWDVAAFGPWVMGSVVALDAASFAPFKNGNVTVAENVGLSAVRAAVHLRRR